MALSFKLIRAHFVDRYIPWYVQYSADEMTKYLPPTRLGETFKAMMQTCPGEVGAIVLSIALAHA